MSMLKFTITKSHGKPDAYDTMEMTTDAASSNDVQNVLRSMIEFSSNSLKASSSAGAIITAGAVAVEEPKVIEPISKYAAPLPNTMALDNQPVRPVRPQLVDSDKPVFPVPEMQIKRNQSDKEFKHILSVAEKVIQSEQARQIQGQKEDLSLDDSRRTGIKRDSDGTLRFKTRYACPKCENRGSHYIPEGANNVDCHECKTTMQVKKATPGTMGPQPDIFMNWYVAGDQKPIAQVVYPDTKVIKNDFTKANTSYRK